jgi:dTMP kinase
MSKNIDELKIDNQNKDQIPYPVLSLVGIDSHHFWYCNPKPSRQKGYNLHHFPALDRILKHIDNNPDGGLIGICGPMGSGKSALLILLSKKLTYQAFYHKADQQRNGGKNCIKTWGSGEELKATCYEKIADLRKNIEKAKKGSVILIDEWQFSDSAKIKKDDLEKLKKLAQKQKIWLIISGLGYSFKRTIWDNTRHLISTADLMIVLTSRCSQENCSNPAIFTQLNIEGQPASLNTNLLMLVGKLSMNYYPKCEKHHYFLVEDGSEMGLKKTKRSGLLISFEGGEGSGKTVQIKKVADEFRHQGKEVIITREPGGTAISEQIREVILSTNNVGMAFTTEVLLFQSARAQIYQELIIPALKSGKIVLCDRTRDSSLVYQGFVRGFDEKLIERLNNISTQNIYPDLTLLLDVPVKIGMTRRNGSEKVDRLDMEKKDFHEKVRKGYLKLAKQNDQNRWEIINASKSIDEVYEEVLAKLRDRKMLE